MWPPPNASMVRVSTSVPAFFFHRFLECWRKTLNAREARRGFWPFRIQLFHHRVIVRHRRRGLYRVIGKAFHVGELQKLIELPFVADRAAQALADVGAAGRTGAVIRINHDVVRHLQIKNRAVCRNCFGQLGCVICRPTESGRPADETKSGITRQHTPAAYPDDLTPPKHRTRARACGRGCDAP